MVSPYNIARGGGLGAWSRALLGLMLWGLWSASTCAQTYGLGQRPNVAPYLDGAFPSEEQSATGWQADEAFPNLTFEDPLLLIPEPGSNRLYVGQRQGEVYWFENDPATTSKTLFLDLSSMTQGNQDCGLLGMAFHPEYGVPGSPNRGYVYIYYHFSPTPTSTPTINTPGCNRLSRFTVPDGSQVADPASELILINQFDRHTWHNGGAMLFGPDGFLYLAIGDEGGPDDAFDQTQKLDFGLFSGVLRIDVDMDPARSHPIRRQPLMAAQPPSGWPTTFTANYYIPNDNPWQDAGGGILEEFYAIGLRSPHRMAYDPQTGSMILGDIGQADWEELSNIEKGGNYQWPYLEGTHAGSKPVPNPLIGTDQPPLFDYAHAEGNNCVIAGYIYRGSEHAAFLDGKYIFGDNGSNRVWAMDFDGTSLTNQTLLCTVPNGGFGYASLSSFGVDLNNEIYMCVMGQGTKIYKLGLSGSQAAPPALLSQTGAFTDLQALTPSPALVPYTVNAPLWSDYAVKSRWIVVPSDGAPYDANETIGFAPDDSWTWPTGTVIVKHFELPIDETNPTIRKRLETRFLVKASNGEFYGLTYKWRADNSDADLLSSGLNEAITVTTSTGQRTQVWSYPSRQECRLCHNNNADQVLGLKTYQLNGDYTYPGSGITDNQLRALNNIGLFSPPIVEADIATYGKASPLGDTSTSLEHRIKSYLDSNCAHCHRDNGPHGALFDARFETPMANQGIVDGPVTNPMGLSGAKVVVPQSTQYSILHLRDGVAGGASQMPPIAKNEVDQEYMQVLTDWINSLVATPLAVGTGSVPNGVEDDPYEINLVAVGGAPPYSWTVTAGSLPAGLSLDGASGEISGTPTSMGWSEFTVEVSDGSGQTTTQQYSLAVAGTMWNPADVITLVDNGPEPAVELGLQFRSDVDGIVTGIRFFKSPLNTGTHVGNLWKDDGTLLASATFTNETTSGWQKVEFSAPVSITAGQIYVASYHCPNGHFSANRNFFGIGVSRPPFYAYGTNEAGGNGRFSYGATSVFPTQTFAAANYWVDVMFVENPPAALTSIAVSPAGMTVTTGSTQQFTATGTFSDSTTSDVTGQVAWSAGDPGIASVDGAGMATGMSDGTTSIIASMSGLSGSAALTVESIPLVFLTGEVPDSVTGVSYSAALEATGGILPYSAWSVVEGALPDGLMLDSASGLISGTPTTVESARFTVELSDAAAQTATMELTMTVRASAPATIWADTEVPGVVDAGPHQPVELGVKFRSAEAGVISGIRFYKSAANTGTHMGSLWQEDGTLLASVTFANETASGWQQMDFASPVQIDANTIYLASYHCPDGHFSRSLNYFTSAGVTNGPLTAISNTEAGGNGWYELSAFSTFPTLTYQASNYWVDVVFQSDASPTGDFFDNTSNLPEGAPANVMLTLSAAQPGPVTVSVAATGGSAVEGSDFILPVSSVEIPAGETDWPFPITILADAEADPGETIELSVSWSSGVLIDPSSLHVVTITDVPVVVTDADADALPDSWETLYGLDTSDDGSGQVLNGPLGDDDRDGMVNLLEYALLKNPGVPDGPAVESSMEIDPADGKRYYMLAFTRWIVAPTIVMDYQATTDMVSWSNDPANFEEWVVTPNADGVTEEVKLRLLPAIEDQPVPFFEAARVSVTPVPAP